MAKLVIMDKIKSVNISQFYSIIRINLKINIFISYLTCFLYLIILFFPKELKASEFISWRSAEIKKIELSKTKQQKLDQISKFQLNIDKKINSDPTIGQLRYFLKLQSYLDFFKEKTFTLEECSSIKHKILASFSPQNPRPKYIPPSAGDAFKLLSEFCP
jgi:hypothetical protein